MNDAVINKSVKKNVQYEIIRIISLFFMIGVHSLGQLTITTVLEEFYNYVFLLLFFTCNGMFFMLSGKFALQFQKENEQGYMIYYFKKLKSIIIPMLFYMLLDSLLHYQSNGDDGFVKFYLTNVFSTYNSQHYWFMYVLVGNIITAPFLAHAFQKMSVGELKLFFWLGILYNGLITYLPLAGINFSWNYIFGGWTFYFYLGFILDRIIIKKGESRKIILIGIACFFISILQKYIGIVSHIHDLAPTFIFITCGTYLFVRDFIVVKSKYFVKTVLFIGRYSFSIYLVHKIILKGVTRIVLGEGTTAFKGWFLPSLIILIFLTGLISTITCVVLDNTFLKEIKKLVDNIWGDKFMKVKARGKIR